MKGMIIFMGLTRGIEKDLDKSKRKNLRHLSFKLVNKNIKIADFRFTYWGIN